MPDKKSLYNYLKHNYIVSIAGIYVLLLLILKVAWNIDIGIPCLWKLLFNKECPGCGLTRAGHYLLVFDVKGAAQSNPLIFIVLPALACYLFQDFRKFQQQNRGTAG